MEFFSAVLTGTPEGVAAVEPGDVMTAGVVGVPQLSMTCAVECARAN